MSKKLDVSQLGHSYLGYLPSLWETTEAPPNDYILAWRVGGPNYILGNPIILPGRFPSFEIDHYHHQGRVLFKSRSSPGLQFVPSREPAPRRSCCPPPPSACRGRATSSPGLQVHFSSFKKRSECHECSNIFLKRDGWIDICGPHYFITWVLGFTSVCLDKVLMLWVWVLKCFEKFNRHDPAKQFCQVPQGDQYYWKRVIFWSIGLLDFGIWNIGSSYFYKRVVHKKFSIISF